MQHFNLYHYRVILQFLDTAGWVTGRASKVSVGGCSSPSPRP